MGEADAPVEVFDLTAVGFAGADADFAEKVTQAEEGVGILAVQFFAEKQAGGQAVVLLEFGLVGGVGLAEEVEKLDFSFGEGGILCDEQWVSFGWLGACNTVMIV